MYCESCGNLVPDGQAFCSNCGAAVAQAASATHPAPAPMAAAPVAAPAPAPAPQPAPQPVYQQPVIITPINNTRTRVNVAATVGLVLGIITLCVSWIPVVSGLPAIPGLIFSIAGVAKKDAGGKGRAITGLIMSSVGLFITLLFIIEMIAGELNY